MHLFIFTFVWFLIAMAVLAHSYGTDICEESWAKVARIRAELGLPTGAMPEGIRYDPRACQALLDTPDERLRENIKEADAICGDVCRKLAKPESDGERP